MKLSEENNTSSLLNTRDKNVIITIKPESVNLIRSFDHPDYRARRKEEFILMAINNQCS